MFVNKVIRSEQFYKLVGDLLTLINITWARVNQN